MSSKIPKRYHKETLPNGIRVIGEELTGYNSVTLGVFVFCGGRDEPADQRGIAHFTEHMFFKGTKNRSALEISKVVDRVGGILNAYTNKEYTCYFIKIVKDRLALAVELLADIFLNSVFPDEELEKEKQVVIQEIGMVNDTPDDLVHDLLQESMFGAGSLGQSLLGTEKHVKSFNRKKISAYIGDYYLNDRIVIAAAGDFPWNDFFQNVQKYFSDRTAGTAVFPERKETSRGENMNIFKKHLYQVHTAIGFETVSVYDEDKYPLNVLNYLLGGGMSSMLFQELREKTGYAYSVYSFMNNYQDTGFLEIYFGTTEENHANCLDKTQEILRRIASGDFPAEDVGYAKEQIKGYTMIAQDSSDARFSYNARGELYYNDFIPIEKELERIYRVTVDDVVATAKKYLSYDRARFAVITPHEKK